VKVGVFGVSALPLFKNTGRQVSSQKKDPETGRGRSWLFSGTLRVSVEICRGARTNGGHLKAWKKESGYYRAAGVVSTLGLKWGSQGKRDPWPSV